MRYWNMDGYWVTDMQIHNGLYVGVSGGVRGFFSHALMGGVS